MGVLDRLGFGMQFISFVAAISLSANSMVFINGKRMKPFQDFMLYATRMPPCPPCYLALLRDPL